MVLAVIVEDKIKEGQLPAYLDHMEELIRLSKQEEGCISYDLYEAEDGSGAIMLLEIWKDSAALDFHCETEYFKRLWPSSSAFKERPSKITKFNRL